MEPVSQNCPRVWLYRAYDCTFKDILATVRRDTRASRLRPRLLRSKVKPPKGAAIDNNPRKYHRGIPVVAGDSKFKMESAS